MTQRDDHDGGASARAQAPARRGRRWLRRLLWLPVLVVAFTVLQVVAFRFIDPPGSVFMAIRQVEAWTAGDDAFTLYYQWRDLDRIAPSLAVSVIAAEDDDSWNAVNWGFLGTVSYTHLTLPTKRIV